MRLLIAVTDGDWYRLLRDEPVLEEVNFWQPSGGTNFRALAPGEPFLFKLHSPNNFIVGGGSFAAFSILPCSLAWEAFERKNGAPSFDEMRRRIERYRSNPADPHDDYKIGCILLQQPFFFEDDDWIPVPPDFARNIVRYKGYLTEDTIGGELWEAVRQRLMAQTIAEPSPSVFGDPVPVQPRLGQGTFRVLITDNYRRRCAVTGERALPALDAAHIRPISGGGEHRADNGLLLRADVHRLYDRGYVTVTPDLRFRVSRRLKTEFANGEPYFPLDGQEIWTPPEAAQQPNTEFLEWHTETVFRA